VVAEANSFVEGWGQVIFPTANEMIANEKMRATFERTPELKKELERKYGVKALSQAPMVPVNLVSVPPGPAQSQTPKSTQSQTPKSAQSQTPKSNGLTANTPTNDGEVRSPTSPRSSKSKNKKRK